MNAGTVNAVGQIDTGERIYDIHERTFRFACRIIRVYEHLQRSRGAGRAIANQLLRSGTSLGANLEEARAGQTRADFVAKCRIALKEARESHYWLRLIAAVDMIPGPKVAPLVTEADEIIAILTSILKKASLPRTSSPVRGAS